MMNRIIIVLILVLGITSALYAQWVEHAIDSTYDGARSVYAIDVDGDNDIDILGAAYDGDEVAWWENDGNENFTKHTVAGSFDDAYAVYAIDLDGDDDVDVLGAGYYADDITWWENDGNENFTEHTIDGNFNGADCIYAIDLDGDDDVDVLGAGYQADEIAWWENDGSENFTKHSLGDDVDGAHSVYAIDLDDDYDIDVLGVSKWDDYVIWWENDGNENFTVDTIATVFSAARSVYACDLDGDDDIDVLGAAQNSNKINWWENDGNENFAEHIIDNNLTGAWSVYAIDIDGDNDMDVLGAGQTASDIVWYENDGDENFTKYIINNHFTGASSIYAVDLDGDMDVDVLGAALYGDAITWWENLVKIHNVGPISIDIPSTVPLDTTILPHATVKNFGLTTETFNVTCKINPGEYISTAVSYLAPGITTQVTFADPFTFIEGGDYEVTVFTGLVGDEDLTNDTLIKIVQVSIIRDVGPVSIDIPASVPEDTSLNPKVTVKNLGTVTVTSFPVICTIEPGGYNRLKLADNLAPGDSFQVNFPWPFTFENGAYTVTVYTQLDDDENLANDTLEKIIETYNPGIAEGNIHLPITFSFGLKSNPARNKTVFNLALPEQGSINLWVYDVTGRIIDKPITGMKAAGYYEIPWSPDVTTGVYFYALESPWQNKVGKLILVR